MSIKDSQGGKMAAPAAGKWNPWVRSLIPPQGRHPFRPARKLMPPLLLSITLMLLIILTIFIPGVSFAWSVPDTGQTKCYNNTEEIPCPSPGEAFYGQDGNYTINPLRYRKVDAGGNDLPDNAPTWYATRDESTGIVWEMKTTDGTRSDKNYICRWDSPNQCQNPGTKPTFIQLLTIVDFSGINPSLNTTFFPNTQAGIYHTNDVINIGDDWPKGLFAINFSDGSLSFVSTSSDTYIRNIISGGGCTPTFVDNGDGTVTDTCTNLMWQKEGESKTWQEAMDYTEGLTLAGYTDWRLPNIKELSIGYLYNSIDIYWSSTTYAQNPSNAWRFNPAQYEQWVNSYYRWANYSYSPKSGIAKVRAVRGGQNRIQGNLYILSPIQGDTWIIGATVPITWESQGISGTVKISVSRQAGKDGTYEIIADNVPNTGYYSWTVSGAESSNCMIKIESISDPNKTTTQGLFSITGDASLPRGGISINAGAEKTGSSTVSLTLTATGSTTITHMQFSNDNVSWSLPEAYATAKAWTIEGGNGVKAVYVKYKDAAGKWSTAYADEIFYDTQAPTTTAEPAGGMYNSQQNVTLSTNEGATIYFTKDGTEPTTASPAYSGPILIDGNTTLKFFAVDGGGNTESVKTETYTINQPLSVAKIGSGNGSLVSDPAGINCGADCTEIYNLGTQVILTATPDSGSTFKGWQGGGCSGTGTCTITMTEAKAVTAVFGTPADATSVSGLISADTNWTLANSPYNVTGNILVSNGITLTIEPGVNVRFNSGKSIQVDGTLSARGTQSAQIIFTSPQPSPAPGDWGYILFSDVSSDAIYDGNGRYTGGSILENAIVEYAGGATQNQIPISNNGAVRINNAHPFINYCTIRSNKASGIYAWNQSSTLKIHNSLISENNSIDGGGIYTNSGTTDIANCVITGNTATNFGGGIYNFNTTIVTNNTIEKNSALTGGGIYLEGYGTITKNIVSSNAATDTGGGICIAHPNWGDLTITVNQNVIHNNQAKNGGGLFVNETAGMIYFSANGNIIGANKATETGGGAFVHIDAWHAPRSSELKNNNITGNQSGNSAALTYRGATSLLNNSITGNKNTGVSPTAAVSVSLLESGHLGPSTVNFNNIFGNAGAYQLWNEGTAGTQTVNAENNWWGGVQDSEFWVFDWVDNDQKSVVDYVPWSTMPRTDTPISPPTGLQATANGDGGITLTWNQNPESDLAGYFVHWGTKSGYPYEHTIDVGKVTSHTLSGVPAYSLFNVTAYDSNYSSMNDLSETIVNENKILGYESWYGTETTGDATPPTGSVIINGGAAFTKTTSVNLNLTCTDANGCTQMRFSNDNTAWSEATKYEVTALWNLTAGDGLKTVYAKFKDGGGNWSTPVSATITLDTIIPTAVPSVPGGVYASPQSVDLNAGEASTIYYTMDGTAPTTASSTYAEPINVSSSIILKYFAKDAAGNDSPIQTQYYIIMPPGVRGRPIPDTGQIKCYNNTEEIPCPAPGEAFYGQDGTYSINPPSYTKLDATGKALPDDAATWTMVRDNVTGLIWENKTNDGTIHDGTRTFTWCDKNPDTNGGNQGTCGTGTGDNATDTEAFIKALNDANFGGFSDWRMPSPTEVLTIANLNRINPLINASWFPNTASFMYWSSSTRAQEYDEYGYGKASGMDFYNGYIDFYIKEFSYSVRAVRGRHKVIGYIENGDGTVTDATTGLMWQKGSFDSPKSWEESLAYSENLSLAGYDDWRLPTISELVSIIDNTQYMPSVNVAFPSALTNYWSSSTAASSGSGAWCANFGTGSVYGNASKPESINKYVRSVRGGQNIIPGNLVIKSPNQADKWPIGSQMVILWDTAGISGNIRITLSRQGGKTGTFTETIADGIPNNGMFPWTATGPSSVNCVLRIEPLADAAKGTSQGLFTIGDIPNPQFILTAVKSGSGSGTIASDPAGIYCGADCSEAYVSGASVTLTATPEGGSTFAGWGGDCTLFAAQTTCTLIMNSAKNVTATFDAPASDTTPPTGTVTINGGAAHTNNPVVTLGLTAVDAGGVTQMCIANTNLTTCTSWETYANSKSWHLDGETDGAKTVYAWFKDTAGNVSAAPSTATIVLDTILPSLTVTTPAANVILKGTTVQITGTVSDTGAGIQNVRITTDRGVTWNNTTINQDGTSWFYVWTLPADGGYDLAVMATDNAGNETWRTDIPVTVKNAADVAVTPGSYAYVTPTLGTPVAQTFTVTNPGGANLTISGVSVSGANASEFSIQNNSCLSQTIAPDGACAFDVIFTPATAGFKKSVVALTSTAPGKENLNLYLSGSAGTNIPVSGAINQNATWHAANSPYVVTGNLVVNTGVQLSIEPGTTVKFNDDTVLRVDGTLIAQGTAAEKITFTSNQISPAPGAWTGVVFSPGGAAAAFDEREAYTGGSILENCVIRYAAIGVNMTGASPFVSKCLIEHNGAGILLGIADNLAGATYQPKIFGNDIGNNDHCGVCLLNGSGTMTYGGMSLKKNHIHDNGFGNSATAGSLQGGGLYIYSENGSVLINGNAFENNKAIGHGYVTGAAAVDIHGKTAAEITGNLFIHRDAGGGSLAVYPYAVPPEVNNKLWIRNNSFVTTAGTFSLSVGAGLWATFPDIAANTFRHTGTEAVVVIADTVNVIGGPTNGSILSNTILSTGPAVDYRLGTLTVNALTNWWGTIDEAVIRGKINDFYDNSAVGMIPFVPMLTAPDNAAPLSPPVILDASVSGETTTVAWQANPETDVAGYRVHYGVKSGLYYTSSVDVGNVTSYAVANLPIGAAVAVTAYDGGYSAAADETTTPVNDNQTAGHESWYSQEIVPDRAGPQDVTIAIEGGAIRTASPNVALQISAKDTSGVAAYYLSENGATPSGEAPGWFAVTPATDYAGTAIFALSPGDGLKTIFVWCKDGKGNVSNSASTSITLDTTIPTVTVGLPGGTYVGAQTVILTPDEPGAAIHFTLDGTEPASDSPVYSQAIVLNPAAAPVILKFIVGDAVGNISPVYTESYNIQGFKLAAAEIIKVVQGETKPTAVTVTGLSGFNTPLNLAWAYEGTAAAQASVVLTGEPIIPAPEGTATPLQFTAAADTPTGTYTLRITAAGAGLIQTRDIQVTVVAPLGIGTTTLPAGDKGQGYSNAVSAGGGIPPYTFTKTAGSLPDGLILNPDGTFAGTPEARGNFTFTIQIADSAGHTATRDYGIRIYDPAYRTFVMEANSWSVEKSTTAYPVSSDWVAVKVLDDHDQPAILDANVQISMASSSGTGRFSLDDFNFSSSNSVRPFINAGTNQIEFKYRDTTLGSPTLTVSGVAGQASANWQGASHVMTVTSPNLQNASLAVSVTANATYSQGVMVTGTLKDAATQAPLAYKTISVVFTSPSGAQTTAYSTQTNSNGAYTYTADGGAIDAAGAWTVQVNFKDGDPAAYNDASVSAPFTIVKADTRIVLNTSTGSTSPNGQVAVSGQLSSFTAFPVDLSGIAVLIDFIEPDGTTAHTVTATTYDQYGHFTFTYSNPFGAEGLWSVRARLAGTGNLNSSTSEAKNLMVATAPGYAILIQGDSGGQYRNNYAASLDDIYKKLIKRSFTDNSIHYLSYNGAQHEEGIVIDAYTNRANIESAITDWAAEKIAQGGVAPLYIVLMDHGDKGIFHLDPQSLTPDDLNGWIATLENSVRGSTGKDLTVIVINGSCYSGSFIPKLSKPGRIVVASAAEDEESAQGPSTSTRSFGEYFVYYLFNNLAKGDNLQDAFKEAAKVTHQLRECKGTACGKNSLGGQGNTRQHPLLDDNGDGKGSWMNVVGQEDGAVTSRLTLGIGTNPAIVTITELMPTQKLPAGTTSLTAWAKADPAKTADAWVEVRKPSYVEGNPGDSGQVVIDLPEATGTYNDASGRWEYNLTNLTEAGTYTLYYYLMDSNGDILPPVAGTFYIDAEGNQPPAPFDLAAPEDNKEVNDAMMVFRWGGAIDPNGDRVTYTVRFHEDAGGTPGEEIKRYELITHRFFHINAAREKRADGQTSLFATGNYYWWTVEAIDDKGASIVSAARRFHVLFTNAITGVLTGIIYSDQSYSLISAANLVATIGGSNINIPVIDGAFVLSANPGLVALASSAGGYSSAYVSDVAVRAGETTTLSIPMSAVTTVIKGDIDGLDGVTINDAILALQAVAGRNPAAIRPDYAASGADVNGDNKIGLAEVLYILQTVGGAR